MNYICSIHCCQYNIYFRKKYNGNNIKKKDLCWIGTPSIIYIDTKNGNRGINKEEVEKKSRVYSIIYSIIYSINISGISKLDFLFIIC